MDVANNKRRAYRLDDRIQVWFHALDEASLGIITGDFEQYRKSYCLKSHFINQREFWQPRFLMLKKRDNDVASYIEHLEQQIIELAERMASSAMIDRRVSKQLLDVNISADGIRFDTRETLAVGQYLELGLDLSTNDTQILLLGRVVRAEPALKGSQCVSIEFIHIHDEDRESLVRHMARVQQLQLQARRAS
jgi:hypothetical protein